MNNLFLKVIKLLESILLQHQNTTNSRTRYAANRQRLQNNLIRLDYPTGILGAALSVCCQISLSVIVLQGQVKAIHYHRLVPSCLTYSHDISHLFFFQ